MPQASIELRGLMEQWFGDGIGDHAPIRFLKSRGYKLTGDWRWRPPVPSHSISDEEWMCMRFLVEEWDFGGIADTSK